LPHTYGIRQIPGATVSAGSCADNLPGQRKTGAAVSPLFRWFRNASKGAFIFYKSEIVIKTRRRGYA